MAGAQADGEVSVGSVKVTSVCPGPCKSRLGQNDRGFIARIIMAAFQFLFFRSTEAGARSLVRAAVEGEHGGFWKNGINEDVFPLLAGESGHQLQECVWQEIIHALRKEVPGVTEYVAVSSHSDFN